MPRGPAACIYRGEELEEACVEQSGLFQVDGVARIREDQQPGSTYVALDEETGFDRGVIFVARGNQCGNGHAPERLFQVVDGGPIELHASERERSAQC